MRNKYTPLDDERRRAAESRAFEPKPNSYRGKIRCRLCHSDGYPGGSWMDPHIAGHTFCCGHFFATGQGLAAHRRQAHAT